MVPLRMPVRVWGLADFDFDHFLPMLGIEARALCTLGKVRTLSHIPALEVSEGEERRSRLEDQEPQEGCVCEPRPSSLGFPVRKTDAEQ